MFLPYYKISERGWSGDNENCPEVAWQSIVRNLNPSYSRFNPYRHIKALGITLGFRQKNYWFSFDTFVGKLLSYLF